MMWPFGKKIAPAATRRAPNLKFKSAEAFFEMQCKYGQTDLQKGRGIVAIVLNSREEFGTVEPVKVQPDGTQLAMVRVAAEDGGFVVPTTTPSDKGDRLMPGDLVVWVPAVHNRELAKGFGDYRQGWVGFIHAKIAAETGGPDNGLRVTCWYD